MGKVKKGIISILVLAVIIAVHVVIIGNSYRFYDWYLPVVVQDPNDVEITMQPEGVVEVTGMEYSEANASVVVRLKGLRKGNVELVAHTPDPDMPEYANEFFVDRFHVILEYGFAGSLNHMVLIRVDVLLLLIAMAGNIAVQIRRIGKTSMYSYSLMFYMGALIFVGVTALMWGAELLLHQKEGSFSQLYSLFSDVLGIVSTFAMAMFPLILLLAVFLVASNLVLLRREGKSLANTLGILLGCSLVFTTLAGFKMYDVLDRIMDVHSYEGMHISRFFECGVDCVLTYFECMILGTWICSAKAQRHVPRFNKDYMIILGCSIRKDGTPTPLLKGRADRAMWFARMQKEASGREIIFVPSGGQGSDEVISEAESIRNYLRECGVPEERILMENRSTTTNENMKYSAALIKERDPEARVAFSTTGYHVFRSGNLAHSHGLAASGVGSRTKWYFYTNALIREFIANLDAEKKKHIINLTLILGLLAMLLAASYQLRIL